MVSLPHAIKNLKGTIALNRQLVSLSEQTTPLTVYFSLFDADRVRLSEAGIAHIAVSSEDQLPCKNPEVLRETFNKVKFCITQ